VDDFPELSPETLCDDSVGPTDVLDLLGWEVKEAEGRLPEYAATFDALGSETFLPTRLPPPKEKRATETETRKPFP